VRPLPYTIATLFLVGLLPVQQRDSVRKQLAALIERASGEVRARKLGAAQRTVDRAWKVAQGMRDLGKPNEGPDLLRRLGTLASRAGRLRITHDAFARIDAHFAATLPPDHRYRIASRTNLAIAKKRLNDLDGALALEQENLRVLADRGAADPLLLSARENHAGTLARMGQHARAVRILRPVLRTRLETLSDDHATVQRLRNNLAESLLQLGFLEQARALQEQVHEVRAAQLTPDAPKLISIRQNLAKTLSALGHHRAALKLQGRVWDACRDYPIEHFLKLRVMVQLGILRRNVGDLREALVLHERALSVLSRTLPPHQSTVLRARTALAVTKAQLGDNAGAEALFREVHRIRSERFPHGNLGRLVAQENLAIVTARLGGHAKAVELFEAVLKGMDDAGGGRPLMRLRVRFNLANARLDIGKVEEALEHAEQALVEAVKRVPDDHPLLYTARLTTARARRMAGDVRGAMELDEAAYRVVRRTLDPEHPTRQLATRNLLWNMAELGDAARAEKLVREWAHSVRARLSRWYLSPRQLGAVADDCRPVVDGLATLLLGCGTTPAIPELAEELLLTAEIVRGIETRAARLLRRGVADADKAAAEQLRKRIAVVSSRIARVVDSVASDEAKRRERAEKLAKAVAERDRLRARLLAITTRVSKIAVAASSVSAIADRLPGGAAAVSVVGFVHHSYHADRPGQPKDELRLVALCIDGKANLRVVPLGRMQRVEDLVQKIRSEVGAGDLRGRSPGAANDSTRVALRKQVLDPILAALPGIKTLFVSLDDSLQLAPLDALPAASGQPIGSRVQLRHVVSLLDLLDEPRAKRPGNGIVVFGGIQYDKPAAGQKAPAEETRTGRPHDFLPLADTESEAKAIAALFRQEHEGKVHLLTGREASKRNLLAMIGDARFVHLATHGYFAARPNPASDSSDLRAFEKPPGAIGLSPFTLCGMALAGANLPANESGLTEGVITADEFLQLDLSPCELVTLSACDTSLGVRQSGRGYASLRAALQGAGTRYVLVSLWKIGDVATRDLMVDLYRRMWVQNKDPHTALWEAREAARKRGAPFRDWAGWVLSGR